MNRKPLTALKKLHVNALDGHPTGSATTPEILPVPAADAVVATTTDAKTIARTTASIARRRGIGSSPD